MGCCVSIAPTDALRDEMEQKIHWALPRIYKEQINKGRVAAVADGVLLRLQIQHWGEMVSKAAAGERKFRVINNLTTGKEDADNANTLFGRIGILWECVSLVIESSRGDILHLDNGEAWIFWEQTEVSPELTLGRAVETCSQLLSLSLDDTFLSLNLDFHLFLTICSLETHVAGGFEGKRLIVPNSKFHHLLEGVPEQEWKKSTLFVRKECKTFFSHVRRDIKTTEAGAKFFACTDLGETAVTPRTPVTPFDYTPTVKAAPEILCGYVPPCVQHMLQSQLPPPISERFTAAMLCVRSIEASAYNSLVYTVQRVLHNVEGEVLEAYADGDSLILFCAFGLVTRDREIVPLALAGVIELHKRLQVEFGTVGTAVVTKPGYSGLVQFGNRNLLNLVGTFWVDLTRLVSKSFLCRPSFLCDRATAEASRSSVVLRAVKESQADLHFTYSTSGKGSKQFRLPRFLEGHNTLESPSRLAERELLDDLIGKILLRRDKTEQVNSPRLICVRGGFGMGKSGLVQYLTRSWALLPVLLCKGQETLSEVPYYCFPNLFEHLSAWLRVSGKQSEEERLLKVPEADKELTDRVTCSADAMFEAEKLGRPNSRKEETRQHLVVKVIEKVLEAVPGLLFCYDDAEFLDAHSQALCQKLNECAAEKGLPIVQVLFLDPGDTNKEWSKLPGTKVITLDKLENSEVARMAAASVSDIWGEHRVSRKVVETLAETAGRNPMLLNELLTHFPGALSPGDTGELSIASVELKVIKEFTFGGIQWIADKVYRRLRRLNQSQQIIVRHAAIVLVQKEMQLPFRILDALLADKMDSAELKAHLDELVEAGIFTCSRLDFPGQALASIWDDDLHYSFQVECFGHFIATMLPQEAWVHGNWRVAQIIQEANFRRNPKNSEILGLFIIKSNRDIDLAIMCLDAAITEYRSCGMPFQANRLIKKLVAMSASDSTHIDFVSWLEKYTQFTSSDEVSFSVASSKVYLGRIQHVPSMGNSDLDGATKYLLGIFFKIWQSVAARRQADAKLIELFDKQLQRVREVQAQLTNLGWVDTQDNFLKFQISGILTLTGSLKGATGRDLALKARNLHKRLQRFVFDSASCYERVLLPLLRTPPAIRWKSDYYLHVPLIDRQHRHIFAYLGDIISILLPRQCPEAEVGKSGSDSLSDTGSSLASHGRAPGLMSYRRRHSLNLSLGPLSPRSARQRGIGVPVPKIKIKSSQMFSPRSPRVSEPSFSPRLQYNLNDTYHSSDATTNDLYTPRPGLGSELPSESSSVCTDMLGFDIHATSKYTELLEEMISTLIHYISCHFMAEEKVMEFVKYPHKESHVYHHQALTEKVLEIQQRFTEGLLTIDVQLISFLVQWLLVHVGHTDKLFADWLDANKKNIDMAAVEEFENQVHQADEARILEYPESVESKDDGVESIRC